MSTILLQYMYMFIRNADQYNRNINIMIFWGEKRACLLHIIKNKIDTNANSYYMQKSDYWNSNQLRTL